jgi:hypothetical protein
MLNARCYRDNTLDEVLHEYDREIMDYASPIKVTKGIP